MTEPGNSEPGREGGPEGAGEAAGWAPEVTQIRRRRELAQAKAELIVRRVYGVGVGVQDLIDPGRAGRCCAPGPATPTASCPS